MVVSIEDGNRSIDRFDDRVAPIERDPGENEREARHTTTTTSAPNMDPLFLGLVSSIASVFSPPRLGTETQTDRDSARTDRCFTNKHYVLPPEQRRRKPTRHLHPAPPRMRCACVCVCPMCLAFAIEPAAIRGDELRRRRTPRNGMMPRRWWVLRDCNATFGR